MQLCSVLEGQSSPRASVVLFLSQNAPRLARIVVHERGDRRNETCWFRLGFLVYDVLLLLAKLSLPSLVAGGGDGDDDVGLWFFLQPLFMAVQGPDAHRSWVLSATALMMSCLCPAWSNWRGDQKARWRRMPSMSCPKRSCVAASPGSRWSEWRYDDAASPSRRSWLRTRAFR